MFGFRTHCTARLSAALPFLCGGLAAIALVAVLGRVVADEPRRPAGRSHTQDSAQVEDGQMAAANYLQTVVDSMGVRLRDNQRTTEFQPRPTPLMTYSDAARGYWAAGVWRLGDLGRPKVLVAIECVARDAMNAAVSFEFLSLTEFKFEVTWIGGPNTWRSDGSVPTFAKLDNVDKPASAERQRLTQMRNLARRFTVSQKLRGEFNELRLMPQPIDRYKDREGGIEDGSIFVFAYGTNPELVILIESDADSWRYALMRSSTAELMINLDGTEVSRFPEIRTHSPRGLYQHAAYAVPQREGPAASKVVDR